MAADFLQLKHPKMQHRHLNIANIRSFAIMNKKEEVMQINYYKDESLQENRIDIYYRCKDDEIQNLITFFESDQVVLAMQEHITKRIFLHEIY